MGSAIAIGNIAALASEVGDVLDSMHSLLDASSDPERRALRALGIDRLGWVSAAYCDEAFQLWSDQLKRRPADFQTIHHLAIMHHARAIDLETGPKPDESNPDWDAALEYWRQLYENGSFWDYVADLACKKTKRDAVDDLRKKFPELLLQVNYDIAFVDGAKKYRAKYHIGLVRQSSFPEEVKAAVQRETYTRVISAVPEEVWQIDMLVPEKIKLGTDSIEAYLAIDPDCVPALEDALRLEVRLLRERYTQLRAAGDDEAKCERLRNALREEAQHWAGYFAKLTPRAVGLDDDIRRKLCLWHRVMGDVHSHLEKHEEAARYYEQGVTAGQEDDDERRICVRGLGEALALLARERAHEGTAGAKQYCDQVRARSGLSVIAHLFLANAYLLLREFDPAEEVCRAGLTLEPEIADLGAMQQHEQRRQHLAQLLEDVGKARRRREAQNLIEQAGKHTEAGRHEEALRLLIRAAGLDPDARIIYFYRAQSHLALDQIAEAEQDLVVFQRSLGNQSPTNVREAADHLQKVIAERKEEIRKFGREAPKLREEAMQAFHAKKYDGAERKMRDAVQKCPPAGKKEMERELAMMLVAEVVETVNAAVKSLEDEPEKTVDTCGAGLKKLEEASRLDPSAKQITKHVESLRKLEAQAREAADSLRKFGRETPKLRGEAAKAYEANQHDLAEKKLREAIQKCPPAGKPDLQRELAIVLVASANAAAEPAFRDDRLSSEAATRLCNDAIAKMEEAGRLDPSEQEITKQMRQLRDYVSSLRTFGREAPKHRRLAMEAFKADNYAAAAQHLRNAINHCPAAGRGDLERELSVILSQWAVRDANAAAEQKNSAAALGEARNRLLEAVSLDAQNENAKTNLAAVERMLSPPSPEEVADEIWQAIRNKLFPAHVTPKEDMCKTMLKFAVEHYPPQEVVSRFVELVKQNPSAFVE